MRLPKRGEKGFTLIELLIVVAILGVLAAVVIPNVGRFIGRGETEAGKTELANLQSAVTAMMVDNGLSTMTNPVSSATNDMFAFPDAISDWDTDLGKILDADGANFSAGDNEGWVLYQCDRDGGGDNTTLYNYVATRWTKGTYTIDSNGTVTQASSGY